MVTELVLVGNGPGELSGWVRPVARAARELDQADLRLTLVLPPSQFAGGREPEVVRTWGLFDRVVDSSTAIRIALGLVRLELASRAAVVHLGGDLWISSRLARRQLIPAGAFTETMLIARRHQPYGMIFAASNELAEKLTRLGVPREKILVTGDPRVDAIRSSLPPASLRVGDGKPGESRITSHESRQDSHKREGFLVSFMPGSRDRFFRVLTPYLLNVAGALASSLPETRFQVVVSEFLSPGLVASLREEAPRRWPGLSIQWIVAEPWSSLARSDVVLTIPGSNTLELGLAGIPFAVVVPTDMVDLLPLEGTVEWIARIPALGGFLRRAGLNRHLARQDFVALPNLRTGRALVPEWIGRWTAESLAKRLAELLEDANGRVAMKAAFRQLYGDGSGASRIIAKHGLALAESVLGGRE